MNPKATGEFICQLRKEKLTQNELAELIQVAIKLFQGGKLAMVSLMLAFCLNSQLSLV